MLRSIGLFVNGETMEESNELGARLRAERERLGLTQEDFSSACGVGRRAQVNYESGERTPGAKYLKAAASIGVDVGYVLDGERTTVEQTELKAVRIVLARMIARLNAATLPDAVEAACRAYQQGFADNDTLKVVVGLVDHALDQSSVLADSERTLSLLSELIWQFELCLEKKGQKMPPHKKANAITMLFRSFIATGKINPKMIEDAVSLAAE